MTSPFDDWPRRPGGPAVTRPDNSGGTLSPAQVDKYVNIAVNGDRQLVLREVSNVPTHAKAINLIDYITRQGTLLAKDPDGNLQDKVTWLSTLETWAASFRPMPTTPDGRTPRNVGHFMLSAPAGSDPGQFQRATEEWLKKTFGTNYDYLSVFHDDTDNPHVHVAVHRNHLLYRNKALTLRDNELDEWRMSAAKICRAHGLAVDASLRIERGATKYNVPQSIHHMIKRGERPDKRVREFINSGEMTDKQRGYLARVLREVERTDLVRELYRKQADADEHIAAKLDEHKERLDRLNPINSQKLSRRSD